MALSHTEVTQRHQTYDTPDGHVDRVVHDAETRPSSTRMAVNVIYTILSVINIMLAIRFVLSLLGANRASAFGDLIYSLTAPLVAPFYGLFGTTAVYGRSRIELETLVAMAIYSLIAWGIVRILLIDRARPELEEEI